MANWWSRLLCRLNLHQRVGQTGPGQPWHCLDCGKVLEADKAPPPPLDTPIARANDRLPPQTKAKPEVTRPRPRGDDVD